MKRSSSKKKKVELSKLQKLASHHVDRKRIQMVISDIEGCLNLDEKIYDYEALTWIREMNRLARDNNVIPFITVCSGRQHAFVEAIVRMIAGRMPAIFENGCGLFFPTRDLYDEYEWHPSLSISDVVSEYDKVRQIVAKICAITAARRVIGKEVMLSLHPTPSMSVIKLYSIVNRALAEEGVAASVSNSASAVDIAPKGIDKGSGLQWLITKIGRELSLELSNVAGVGDSNGDLSFLRIVGFSTAPANASEEVKAMVAYCSRATDGWGVVDIIQQCIAINMGYRRKGGYYGPFRMDSKGLE